MYEVLQAYFERNFPLTDEHLALIKKIFVPKKLRKGHFLLREGEVGKHAAFVSKGMLRSYVIDDKGKEHIVQFAPENWWISDKPGLNDGKPSEYFIDAVEDSELLLLDMSGHIILLEKLPGYARSFRTGIQKRTAAQDHRIVASLTATAKERYDDFLSKYSDIALRVPQHMLASYLGITPETLSRIRKQKVHRP